MKLILTVAAGLLLCTLCHGFLQNTPAVQAATQAHILEYNRLARLAAEAPDIHIFYTDAPFPGFQAYSFNTNLGSGHRAAPFSGHLNRVIFQDTKQQSVPFRAPSRRPVNRQLPDPHVTATVRDTPRPFTPYTGPFASSVPAGLHGPPVPVMDTPEVQAAKAAHLRALEEAYQAAYRAADRANRRASFRHV